MGKVTSKTLISTAILVSFLTTACGGGNDQQATGPQAVPVKLTTLETAKLIESTDYVGSLEAVQRVTLAPRISGRILQVFAQNGDQVTAGQPIVQLEPTQQQEDVNAALSNVNVEKARLGQVEAEMRTAEAERAGTAADVERARADVQDLKAQLELAQINYDRSEFLVSQGVQPKQDLDDKTRDLNTTKARRDAAQETLIATEKQLEAADKRVEQAVANIEAQKASVSRSEAQLGSVTQNLDFNTVRAPIDGTVGDFPVKTGDFVNVGQELTTITNDDTFFLRISVPVERRGELRMGLPVEIMNANRSTGIKGEISMISPTVDQNAQAVLVKAAFENNGNLKDDEFVRARIIWDEQPGVLIPTTAVSTLGDQKFVFVAEPGESSGLVVKQRPIEVGSIQGQAYQVLSGVEAGQQIAVTRILDLRDGTPITEESVKSEVSGQ